MSDEDKSKELEAMKAQLEALNTEKERMQAKMEELLSETKAAKAKAKAEAEAAAKAAEEAARKSGDTEALEKSWQEKLGKREAELMAELQARDRWLDEITVEAEANRLASELDFEGSAKLLLPLIKPRLKRDVRDGRPVVAVLDATGKPSASTLDDLKAEFLNDASLARFVKGSSATGGGAAGAKSGGAAVKTMKRDAFESLDPSARVAFCADGGQVIN